MTCHVYLLAHEDDDGELVRPVKVGITTSLQSRLATIQTGNPRKVRLVFSYVLPTREMARLVEANFHKGHAEYRLEGEWFDMTPHHAMLNLYIYTWMDAIEQNADIDWSAFNTAVDRLVTLIGSPMRPEGAVLN